MHNLFRLSSRASMEGYYYQPRADRELLAEYAAGLIGTTGCPSGEVQTWLRIGDYAKARKSAADFQDILGRDNYFIELMDHDLAIEKRVRDGLLQLSKDLAHPGDRDQRLPLRQPRGRPRPRAPAVRVVRVGDERPQALPPRRRRLLHQVRGRDARAVGAQARHEGGVRQHPPDRRAVRGQLHRGQRHLHAALPGARRATPRRPGSAARSRPGSSHRYPGGIPTAVARAGRLRDGRHPPDGLPGLLPGRRRLHQLGQGQRHPGRSGPRLRGRLDVRLRDADHRPRPARARPAVRALPQPRARLDARLRHRLRRASARRGDPLRHREVRRGPRLDDRHLRHDQGQAGGQGLQPDPRLPVRDGRPDHQGDAGRGDGQGHPAQGDLRPRAQAATARAGSSARSTRPTRTSRPSSTPRSASRGSSGSGACTPPA